MRTARPIYRCGSFTLGRFRLDPGAPDWSQINNIGAGHHVVFPGTPVRIQHAGREPVVTDHNTVVLYRPFEDYRRGVVGGDGDRCVYVIVAPPLLHELTETANPFAAGATHLPAPAVPWLVQRLVTSPAAGGAPDRLLVEESIIGVLARVLGGRPRTGGRGVVEDTKGLLATRYAENLTLAEIARGVYASPYHLARVFRAQTGWSIHAYRTQLRVRASLALLADRERSIAEIAAACGFSSHGHFTATFRRVFGLAPSAVRDPRRLEMSTLLEA